MFVQEYLNSVFEEKVEKMHMVSILCCFLNKKKIYQISNIRRRAEKRKRAGTINMKSILHGLNKLLKVHSKNNLLSIEPEISAKQIKKSLSKIG